jgi:aspartate carbamoyltransferase catalytic subunit
MQLKHFIKSQQLTKKLIFSLFNDADKFKKINYQPLRGKIIATLFYEPSTRTRLSFESAMQKLGGTILSTENAKEFSSAVKGESLEDTIRVIGAYVDGIVIRHFEEGAAKKAASISNIPIINAGDGEGQHPSQALLDLYTIYKEKGKIDGIKIAIIGDLANGRTARSLCYLLAKFSNIEIIFVSPENMKMKNDIKNYIHRKGIKFREEKELNKAIQEVDLIYMTRIQKERTTLDNYNKAKGIYKIDEKNLHLINSESRILHPLPHCEEISIPIETEKKDKRIAYFRQAQNGLYIRMALLNHLLKYN